MKIQLLKKYKQVVNFESQQLIYLFSDGIDFQNAEKEKENSNFTTPEMKLSLSIFLFNFLNV